MPVICTRPHRFSYCTLYTSFHTLPHLHHTLPIPHPSHSPSASSLPSCQSKTKLHHPCLLHHMPPLQCSSSQGGSSLVEDQSVRPYSTITSISSFPLSFLPLSLPCSSSPSPCPSLLPFSFPSHILPTSMHTAHIKANYLFFRLIKEEEWFGPPKLRHSKSPSQSGS